MSDAGIQHDAKAVVSRAFKQNRNTLVLEIHQ